MRLAVLSDVHGNLPALEAVLDDLSYHPIDRIIFAGDFIGGPQPVETFLRLSSVEAIMITGNSDTNLTKLRTGQAPREWHVRRILRERGIPLVGQKPETMLQRIPLKALLGEINMTMLQEMEVFQNEINRPLRFWSSRFGQSFFVFKYCRMLHTLHTGTVQSKKAGAKWAKYFVDIKWVKLIDQAWKEREGVRFGVKIGQRAELSLLYETLEFIKYAVTRIDHMEVGTTGPFSQGAPSQISDRADNP